VNRRRWRHHPIGRGKRVNVDRRQSQVACNAERAARSAAGSNPRHQANRVGTLNSSQDYLDLARGKFPTLPFVPWEGRKNFELPHPVSIWVGGNRDRLDDEWSSLHVVLSPTERGMCLTQLSVICRQANSSWMTGYLETMLRCARKSRILR
jgi:hypothetical protein